MTDTRYERDLTALKNSLQHIRQQFNQAETQGSGKEQMKQLYRELKEIQYLMAVSAAQTGLAVEPA